MAASMQRGANDAFDRVLREAVDHDSTPDPVDGEQRSSAAVEDDAIAGNEPERAPRDERQVDEAPAAPADNQTRDVLADDGADVTDEIRRGGTEQSRKAAGKGTGTPRTSSEQPASEPAEDANAPAAHADAASIVPVTAPLPTNGSAQPARGAEPTLRGSLAAALESSGAKAARAATAGYGVRSNATLQMLQQARDSVFRQILMKLNDDGGEMRMTLQPPELGELDLRMTVEGGNRLTLVLAAERPDLNQLLARHLDELKQTLQQNGLEISGAEVATREELAQRDAFARQQEQQDRDGNPSTTRSEQPELQRTAGGYVRADGLDFWA